MRNQKFVWIRKIFYNDWARLAAFSAFLLYELPKLGLMRHLLLAITGSISLAIMVFMSIHIGMYFNVPNPFL